MKNGNPGMMQMTESRNYGVDLLRILAMLYVVILHAVGPGGILAAAAEGTVQYKAAWFLETWTYCAVNIFALVSGYVSYTERERKTNWSSYVMLWLQVVFYGVAVTLVFNALHPELVTKARLYQMFFPVTGGLYWYLNAYTGLFAVMPLLNAGLRKCPAETARKAFVVLFLVFSVYEGVVRKMAMSSGYSFAWVLILYLLGAIMKKCGIGKELTAAQAWIGTAVLCLMAWFWRMYGPEFTVRGIWVGKDIWISYLSPMVLGAAVLHLAAFSKWKLSNGWKKVIAFAAPGSFAVYILNCHWVIWTYMMTDKFARLASRPVHIMVFWVLVFSCVFVVVSILIDRVRIFLFEVFRVRKIVDKLVGVVERAVTAVAERL